jgi:hypothetical protein
VRKQTSVSFGIVAVGDDLQFRWKKGTKILAGEDGPSIFIPKVNPSHAGMYAVKVSNPHGAVESSARLTVR